MDNSDMKLIKIHLILLSFLHAQLSPASAEVCTQENIDNFKSEYIKLQNLLKADGSNIELNKNKKVKIIAAVSNDPNFKEATEKALFSNYQNALTKIQKIYQEINKEEISKSAALLKGKPEVTAFFKSLDPNQSEQVKNPFNINIKTLLSQLMSITLPNLDQKFKLNDQDTYLLENLLVHSQDLSCTLDQYKQFHKLRLQNMEVLKNAPLNKMIQSLKKMQGTNELKLANQDITLNEAVKASLDKMRAVVNGHIACQKKLRLLNIGEYIQSCNYGKFMKSLLSSDNNFNQFESILHFINANQRTKDARTNMDWIQLQFNTEAITKCYYDNQDKINYIENLPRINGGRDIDTKNLSCFEGSKSLSGKQCLAGLKFETIVGRGDKITTKEGSKIDKVSFKNSGECNNFSLTGPPPIYQWPVGLTCNEKNCEDQLGIFNKDKNEKYFQNFDKDTCSFSSLNEPKTIVTACKPTDSSPPTQPDKPEQDERLKTPPSIEDECIKKNKDWINAKDEATETPEVRTNRFHWDGKECKDKLDKKTQQRQETSERETKAESVYTDQAAPPRFQPINIPIRQVFILPGMP